MGWAEDEICNNFALYCQENIKTHHIFQSHTFPSFEGSSADLAIGGEFQFLIFCQVHHASLPVHLHTHDKKVAWFMSEKVRRRSGQTHTDLIHPTELQHVCSWLALRKAGQVIWYYGNWGFEANRIVYPRKWLWKLILFWTKPKRSTLLEAA